MRAFATITAVTLAFAGYAFLLGTAPIAAFWLAITTAILLSLLLVRGPEPLFAWITGDHPDAKGSLDTHTENTP